VTTDTALAAFACAAAAFSLYWARRPTFGRSLMFGLLLAGAFLSKFSSLAFLPAAWALMYAWHLWRDRPGWGRDRTEIARAAPHLPLACAVAALSVWAMYHFDYGPAPFFGRPVPAFEFFNGIASVLRHDRAGHQAYLLGQLRTTGFWYYYLVALSVKTTLAMLILFAASVVFLFLRRRSPGAGMAVAFVLGVLAVGMTSHINIGVRHVLPVYSGFAVCGGIAAARLAGVGRAGLIAAFLLVGWHTVSGALAHPEYLSYSNELAGGHLERILIDSDLDWFQDMRRLATRLKQLHAKHLYLKANDPDFMTASGLELPPWDVVPDGDRPPTGWCALQVTWWKLSQQPKWGERFQPREKIGQSIFLYYFPEGAKP
jgi:4-amino-4-deoxy-L-arabinose transferase-like glycosyltransferase